MKKAFQTAKEKVKSKIQQYKKNRTMKTAMAPLRLRKSTEELGRTGKKVNIYNLRNSVNKKQDALENILHSNLSSVASAYEAENRQKAVERGEIPFKNMTPLERSFLSMKANRRREENRRKELENQMKANPFANNSPFGPSLYNQTIQEVKRRKSLQALENKNNPFLQFSNDPKDLEKDPEFEKVYYELQQEKYKQREKEYAPKSPRLALANNRSKRVKAMLQRENTPEYNVVPPPLSED